MTDQQSAEPLMPTKRPALRNSSLSGASARLRPSQLTAVAIVLVGIQAVVRGWVVSGSYYFQDDFAHLDMARDSGLSGEYLVRDYGGHVEMGQYFLLWLLSHAIDGSFAPAALVIVLMQAVASLLLFALLRTLFGNSPLLLLPWSVYLFTPLAVGWSSWLSAALQALPLQIATISVLLAVTKTYMTGSRRWGVVSVAAFAGGLLMWQKAGLILPLAVAVQLLVLAYPQPWRQRLVGLRRMAPLWMSHIAVLAVYVAFYVSIVDDGLDTARPEAVDMQPLFGQTLFRMFVPGVFGGPWHHNGAESTIYPYTETYPAMVFLFALALVVAVSFLVTGRRAVEGWLLLVGYLTADLSLLVLGRSDWLGLLLRDPRYVADALPVLAIAVLAAFRGLWEPAERSRKAVAWLRPHLNLRMATFGSLLLLASGLVTTVRLAPHVQHEYAANYARGVARQMNEDPRRSVINTMPPYEISARADLEGMMNAIGADVVFDRPAVEMFLFDGLAQLKRMDLYPGSDSETGPAEKCGWPVGGVGRELWEIDADEASPRVLRLGYYAGSPATLEVAVSGRRNVVRLPAGLGRAFLVVGADEADIAARVTDGASVCVTDVAVGPAWVADEPEASAPSE